MPQTLLTDVAVELIRTASGDASQVAISHVALGDGLGAVYAPAYEQTALRRELVRVPIERRHALGNDSWRVKAEFPANTPAFMVREMGFFTADGALIALWAGLDIDPRQTGVIVYLVDHILNFSRVDAGLVIVAAPDDELFDFAVATLSGQATQSLLIFNLQENLA
jgi:Phage tail-collar fibre protein